MTERLKYKEGDRFYEVTFQIPRTEDLVHNNESVEAITENVIGTFPDAVNIQALRCDIYREPPRLSISKQSSSYSISNPKDESQVIEVQ